MNDTEKIALIRDVFVGRDDCYLEQWTNIQGTHYSAKQEPITDSVIRNHLIGTKTVSVYQINTDDTVKFMCFDVDVSAQGKKELSEDAWKVQTQEMVRAVVRVLFKLRIPFRVEQSGSKGYHVWVFFDTPIQTRKVYSLAHFLHTYFPRNSYVNVEVFPKQQEYTGGVGFGIKLPLGIHRKTDMRCLFVTNTFEPHDDQWSMLTKRRALTEQQIDAILEEWEVEQPQKQSFQQVAKDYVCMSRIMDEGVTNGNRDTGIFQLACYLHAQGMPLGIAETVIHAVPDNGDPPMSDAQIATKLSSAYEKQYHPSPCKDRNLDSFCSSSCARWPTKQKSEWTRYGRAPSEAIGSITRD